MSWARLDDRLHAHPKARRAGLEAMGLWALCLSFCGAYNTDGQIGRADVEAIGGRRAIALAGKLVEVGLWTPMADGWGFHDFLTYNFSAEQVEADRLRKSAAGKRGGQAKARNLAGASAPQASESLAGASPVLPPAAVLPIPSRPDPVPRDPEHTHTAGVGDPVSGSDEIMTALMALPLVVRAAQPVPGGDLAALRSLADQLAGRAESSGRRIAWVLVALGEAVADLAAEHPLGPSWAAVTKRLRTYADRARKPDESGPSAPRRANPALQPSGGQTFGIYEESTGGTDD